MEIPKEVRSGNWTSSCHTQACNAILHNLLCCCGTLKSSHKCTFSLNQASNSSDPVLFLWSGSSIFSIHCPPATYVIPYQHILYTGPIYNILNTSTSHSGYIWRMDGLRLSSVQSENWWGLRRGFRAPWAQCESSGGCSRAADSLLGVESRISCVPLQPG